MCHLQRAVGLIKKRCLKSVRCSIVLETESILPEGAPINWNKPYLNMIVVGETSLTPQALLQELKKIERDMGRPKSYEKWAPRIIDLDILLWDNVIINTPHLKIPHPEIKHRPFLIHLLTMMGKVYKNIQVPENCFLRSLTVSPRLVGIINVTSDSFSDGGVYNTSEKAIKQAFRLIEEGASVIEIGAQSTWLKATLQSSREEYAKLHPILEALKPLMADKSVIVSIDTFQPFVIRQILKKYPISWINDQKSTLDDKTLRLIAAANCKLCIMHSLEVPLRKNPLIPWDKSPIEVIMSWAKRKKEYLLGLGLKEDSLIIDPGIGFGKSVYQNLETLRSIEKLKSLDLPILVGHSRKSYMKAFSKEEAKDRDIETIAISHLLSYKVDFLRVHNVAAHMRFFAAYQALEMGVSKHV